MSGKAYQIFGTVIDRTTRRALKGLRVEAWDKDLLCDDLVGSATTDEMGHFVIVFDESYFRELFLDRHPDLYFRIFQDDNLIATTEDSVLWNIAAGERQITLDVLHPPPMDEQAFRRCDGTIRRLLRMSDQEIMEAWQSHQERLSVRGLEIAVGEGSDSQISSTGEGRSRWRYIPPGVLGRLRVDVARHLIRIPAIIKFAGNAQDLRGMSIAVRCCAHDIFTIDATKAQLAMLASQAATQSIHFPRQFVLEADSQVDPIPFVQAQMKEQKGVTQTGKGVIIGIIDSTIDVRHQEFRKSHNTNKTRFKYLWVQDPSTDGPEGVSPSAIFPENKVLNMLEYGYVYKNEEINETLNLSFDKAYPSQIAMKVPLDPIKDTFSFKHGTAVASLAAGNTGAAPDAEIVYVTLPASTADTDALEDYILDGLKFIFAIAEMEEMPIVVNASLGTTIGPHNGRTLFDEARDNMLDSYIWRSITWAAGNDNLNGYTSSSTMKTNESEEYYYNSGLHSRLIPYFKTGPWYREIDFWYQEGSGDLQFKLRLLDSKGANPKSLTEWISADIDEEMVLGTTPQLSFAAIYSSNPLGANGFRNLRLVFKCDTSSKVPINLNLMLKSKEQIKYWAWVGPDASLVILDPCIQDQLSVSDMGCCRSILTVGSCGKAVAEIPETMSRYTNPDWYPADLAKLVENSGCGPTMDGRVKPEIVAIGGDRPSLNDDKSMLSVACLDDANLNNTGYYRRMTGTSMASPVVAGAVALMLQKYVVDAEPDSLPYFTQDMIKLMLCNFASRDGLYNDPRQTNYKEKDRNQYGYGRLRLLEILTRSVESIKQVDVFVKTAKDDTGVEPYIGERFWHAPEVEIINEDGDKTTKITWNKPYKIRVTVYNLGYEWADKTQITLYYGEPNSAQPNWQACKNYNSDGAGQILQMHKDIGQLSAEEFVFDGEIAWTPDKKLDNFALTGTDHFCMLIIASHQNDPFSIDSTSDLKHSIRSSNNIAQKNLIIA